MSKYLVVVIVSLLVLIFGVLVLLPPPEEEQLSNTDAAGNICAQVITPAVNSSTGACVDFPTPCDVPEGWTAVQGCEDVGEFTKAQKPRNMLEWLLRKLELRKR